MAIRNPRLTRERLLQTAFQEIHAHGFQGMRVDEVLRMSGLRKGAFYHHFNSKAELGYAVLDEKISALVEAVWLEPLAKIEDPVRELPRFLETLGEHVPPSMLLHGCPLNNLAQEMASQDEEFRRHIAHMFTRWIDRLESLFDQAKADNYIRADVDSRAVARFLVALLEGCVGVYKAEQAAEQWSACHSQITAYLETLRP